MSAKPAIIQSLEEKHQIKLEEIPNGNAQRWAKPNSYAVNKEGQLVALNIQDTNLGELVMDEQMLHLQKLSLTKNKLTRVKIEVNLPELEILDMSYNGAELEPIEFNFAFEQLEHLYIYQSGLKGILFKRGLKKLNTLHLAANKLRAVNFPPDFDCLETLYLQDNEIESKPDEPAPLSLAPLLKNVHLNLKIHNNPFLKNTDRVLKEDENHREALLGFLQPYLDKTESETVVLPAKVLLLGNHASGKSSLLHFIQEGSLMDQSDSTHIINIQSYPKTKKENDLPQAVFYDFGGQDYYHGLYRVFLSQGAVQVILWNSETNFNHVQEDGNKVATIHYALNYWLGQNTYWHNEKYENVEEHNPILLVQRSPEILGHGVRDNSISDLLKSESNIQAEFSLILKKSVDESGQLKQSEKERNKKAREYFLSWLQYLVGRGQKELKKAKWYLAFLKYILQGTFENPEIPTAVNDLENKLRDEFGRKDDSDLRTELTQLHRQGLVLYYQSEMPDKVWLNPQGLVQYVHDHILSKERKRKNRDGKVPQKDFDKYNEDVIQLLLLQKVIFLPDYKEDEPQFYIIPNYLQLAEEDEDYDLFTFGIKTPLFVLRFEHFIPFGLINQMICFYGRRPAKRQFWRNQLLFTFREKLVLMQLDFEQLEIRVHANAACTEEEKRCLFVTVMDLYWDKPQASLEDYYQLILDNIPRKNELSLDDKRRIEKVFDDQNSLRKVRRCPNDLLVSLNDLYFVTYKALENFDEHEDKFHVQAFVKKKMKALKEENSVKKDEAEAMPKEQWVVHKEQVAFVPVHPFQFFVNRKLPKMKKVFISYSRKDFEFKEGLKTHLSIYTRYGAITEWDCEKMRAGEWDEQIQKELAEADIILYMISANFMSSDYIMEEEVKKGIEMVKSDLAATKQIMCVLVRECPWQHWSELQRTYDAGDLDLTRFQFWPQHIYHDEKGTQVNPEILALDRWGGANREPISVAYSQIAKAVFGEVKNQNS
jgi:internalin A